MNMGHRLHIFFLCVKYSHGEFFLINIKMLFQRSAVGRGSGNATGELFQSETERSDRCPTMLRYRRPVCKTFPSSKKKCCMLEVGSLRWWLFFYRRIGWCSWMVINTQKNLKYLCENGGRTVVHCISSNLRLKGHTQAGTQPFLVTTAR